MWQEKRGSVILKVWVSKDVAEVTENSAKLWQTCFGGTFMKEGVYKKWEETLISSHFIEYFISISYIKLAMNSFIAGSQLQASW